MRRNLEREIHMAHRRIDFEGQERRIEQEMESGRITEEEGERRLAEMQRRIESEEEERTRFMTVREKRVAITMRDSIVKNADIGKTRRNFGNRSHKV